MPTEWTKKSWAPGASGWPTFNEKGQRVTDQPSGERVEIYRSDGKFGWRYMAANGEEEARSSELYEHRDHALEQARAAYPTALLWLQGTSGDFYRAAS